ncbi:MAG: ATP-dependent RNA helicase SUPV3L1/SUV3 [Bacteriovoracaceae bacterium]
MEINKLFEEVEENLESHRKVFIRTNLDDDEGDFRSLSDTHLILKSLKEMAITADEMFRSFNSLESLFEKEFGKFKLIFNRDSIIQICIAEDYLIPDANEFPLPVDHNVSTELLDNYVLSFKDWLGTVKEKHQDTQKFILENFNLELKQSELDCHCVKCTADFRAKLRDTIFQSQISIIDTSKEELENLIVEESISYISDYVSKMRKRLDRGLGQIKYRLKRGSLNKLDSDVKAHFKRTLGPSSEIGIVYRERLVTYFNGLLTEEGHSTDVITENEFDRFFTQIGIGIWKSPILLKKEFDKLLRSVLAFKRKDISATILREYLGQFWIHSDARQKNRRVVYHMGPTNSGKTYNAIEALSKSKNGCYLAPLRLLASELFDTLNDKGCPTTLLTGEEVIDVEGATHFSSTIEMAKLTQTFECVVIDEIQMITDPQRGWAWTRALVNSNADEIHLCGDNSVYELVKQILDLTGDTLEVCNYERKTNLTVMPEPIKLVDMEKNDALIVFSRRNALKYKRDLENLNFKVSIVYGRLSPEVRREQARKFDEGETDIMVATDAIAMGMNLPVKRIVFTATSKFYDGKEHPLSNSELKQIAGRAGRFQRFPEGYVTTLTKVDDGIEIVKGALNHDLEQKELAMVGPDLEIFRSVNMALEDNNLKTLSLSEFLRLFNTMTFEKPFYCVDLREMIELAETVEDADSMDSMSDAEIFGFACAPVNQGLMEHVQYYVWILNHYVGKSMIVNEEVNSDSDDIDYLETAIKCVELYQWLARHFENNYFSFDIEAMSHNKSLAIEKLNQLLSEKTSPKCSSCGAKLDDEHKFNICETCFAQRRRGGRGNYSKGGSGSGRRSTGRSENRSTSSSDDGPKKSFRRKPGASTKPGAKPSSAPNKPSGFKKKKSKKSKASAYRKG